jgi:uncharacterized protein YraI
VADTANVVSVPEQTEVADNFIHYTATANVKLRSGTDVDEQEVTVIKAGEVCTGSGALSEDSLWIEVDYQTYHGWVYSEYLAQN